MAQEIEAKMPMADFSPLIQRLVKVGATPVVRIAETNIFLDRPSKALRRKDNGLRIRLEHDRDTRKLRSVIITHKGPRLPGPLKSRVETELEVHSADDALALFEALGYQVMLRFEKNRDRWHLGGCRIELDTLPLIGSFVEIEGPSEAVIQKMRTRLQLDDLPLEPAGYASLLSRELKRREIDSRVIRFKDYKPKPAGKAASKSPKKSKAKGK